jgi:hypothetical protein
MLEHALPSEPRAMRRMLNFMEDAAEARRRGDLAAADAAEMAAVIYLRTALTAAMERRLA